MVGAINAADDGDNSFDNYKQAASQVSPTEVDVRPRVHIPVSTIHLTFLPNSKLRTDLLVRALLPHNVLALFLVVLISSQMPVLPPVPVPVAVVALALAVVMPPRPPVPQELPTSWPR